MLIDGKSSQTSRQQTYRHKSAALSAINNNDSISSEFVDKKVLFTDLHLDDP
jgi:hypothetical protein